MTTTPLYIFDLDGTLALIEHRLHFIQQKPKDWRSFFAAVGDDEPNKPVIDLLYTLGVIGGEIWVWSGRSDECQVKTREWLQRHGCPAHALRMRKAGDYRDDAVVKAEWLASLKAKDRARLAIVFDDRDRVVKMWRDAGVTCFQVAPGSF